MSTESGRPNQQRDGEPVIEDAGLPYMQTDSPPSTDLMLSVDRLLENGKLATPAVPTGRKLDDTSTARMAAFDENASERTTHMPRDEQREGETPNDRAGGYLRLRLRLENGRISVVGAHSVEGPLAFDESLQGALVYEIRDEKRRIGIGTVPDVGEMRSFAPPEPLEGQIGHHIVPLRAVEFNVRIRNEDLSSKSLPSIRIGVYEMKEPPERVCLSGESLLQQFGREARLVAELSGLQVEKLEPRVREDLKRALR